MNKKEAINPVSYETGIRWRVPEDQVFLTREDIPLLAETFFS